MESEKWRSSEMNEIVVVQFFTAWLKNYNTFFGVQIKINELKSPRMN